MRLGARSAGSEWFLLVALQVLLAHAQVDHAEEHVGPSAPRVVIAGPHPASLPRGDLPVFACYTCDVRFEWDPEKAVSNTRKHGIAFDEAVTVFKDPLALIFDDSQHSEAEDRELIIGSSALRRMILACFVEGPANTIRLISARRATRNEIKDYEENAGRQIT